MYGNIRIYSNITELDRGEIRAERTTAACRGGVRSLKGASGAGRCGGFGTSERAAREKAKKGGARSRRSHGRALNKN